MHTACSLALSFAALSWHVRLTVLLLCTSCTPAPELTNVFDAVLSVVLSRRFSLKLPPIEQLPAITSRSDSAGGVQSAPSVEPFNLAEFVMSVAALPDRELMVRAARYTSFIS